MAGQKMRVRHGLVLIIVLSAVTFLGLFWFQFKEKYEGVLLIKERTSLALLRWGPIRPLEDQTELDAFVQKMPRRNMAVAAKGDAPVIGPEVAIDNFDMVGDNSDLRGSLEDLRKMSEQAEGGQDTNSGRTLIERPKQDDVEKDPVVSRLLGQCKQWRRPFAERFSTECGFWIDRVTRWDVQPKMKEVGYRCSQDVGCPGWGDRIGGLSSVFFKAMAENGSLHIGIDGLPELISPCLFSEKSWSFKNLAWNDTCKARFNNCQEWRAMECTRPNQDMLAYNLDQVCTPPELCNELQRHQQQQRTGTGLAANTLGCTLRTLIEPSEEVWSLTKYPVRNGNASIREMSLKALDDLFNKYYIIGIDVRIGNDYAVSIKNSNSDLNIGESGRSQPSSSAVGDTISLEEQLKPHLMYPFRCAATIESSVLGEGILSRGDTSEIYAPDGRPVRWFLSTDSSALKLAAHKLFPGRLITMDFPQRQVSLSYDPNPKETLRQTMVEWYLIGRGDELIVNRMLGSNPEMVESDFVFGRGSIFSETSRAYHLRSDQYDAATCVKSHLPQEGAWRQTGCSHQRKRRPKFPQTHLLPLKKAGLTFPASWVSRGVIHSSHRNRSNDGRAEIDEEGESDAIEGTSGQLKAKSIPKVLQDSRELWTEPDDEDVKAIELAMGALSRPTRNIQVGRFVDDVRSCAPRACKAPKSFIAGDQPKSNGYVYLASFPGSGNTWVRSVIEDGTKVFTGSDYDDLELKESGFVGEGPRILYESRIPKVAVVKTHYPLFEARPHPNITSLIVLVRCPFDAIYAEFNRQYSLGHTKTTSVEEQRANFPNFFRLQYPEWIKSMQHFFRPKFWESPLWTRWQNNSYVTSPVVPIRLTPFALDPRSGDRLHRDLSVPGLIVFYEDLVRDFERTVAGLFAFLEQQLGQSIPVSARDAQACALLEYVNNPKRGKRQEEKTKAKYNPYLDPNSDLGRNPSQIEKFCAGAEAFWLDNKWGPCKEAPYLQSQRHYEKQSREDTSQINLERFVQKYCS